MKVTCDRSNALGCCRVDRNILKTTSTSDVTHSNLAPRTPCSAWKIVQGTFQFWFEVNRVIYSERYVVNATLLRSLFRLSVCLSVCSSVC